MIEAVTFI